MGLDLSLECPCCGAESYSGYVTHNLGRMADLAGLYRPLWRADEEGIELACQLVEPLDEALTVLLERPEDFYALNPENGYGSFEGLVKFVERALAACKEHPNHKVTVWR